MYDGHGHGRTVFLDTLNNKRDGDETTACTSDADCAGIGNGKCGHAGFRDWRVLHVKELQSIEEEQYHRRVVVRTAWLAVTECAWHTLILP